MIEGNETIVMFVDENGNVLVRYGWDMIIPQIGSRVSFSPYYPGEETLTVPDGNFLVRDVEYNYRAYDNRGGINKKTRIVITCVEIV